MNHFYIELQVKEKIGDIMNEGLRSQVYHRSGVVKASFLRRLPKLILMILGILGMVGLLVR